MYCCALIPADQVEAFAFVRASWDCIWTPTLLSRSLTRELAIRARHFDAT